MLKKFPFLFAVPEFLFGFFLAGCSHVSLWHDNEVKKSEKDFLNLIKAPPTPVSPPLCLPKPLEKKPWVPSEFSNPVSIALAGHIPLASTFLELARQAGVNIFVDDTGCKKKKIFYQAHEQPFSDVLNILCEMCGFRYEFSGRTLRILPDTPYFKNHNIQFLLGSRKIQTQTSVKTDIFSSGIYCSPKNSTDNGSSITMNAQHNVDFWEELERGVKILLQSNKKQHSNYSINRYAGLLSIYATEKQHQLIAEYLKRLQKLITTQILIEAKIIEIDLLDEYKSGVDWQAFFTFASGGGGNQSTSSTSSNSRSLPIPLKISSNPAGPYSINLETRNLQLLAQFMSKFGTMRTLANPRQTVLNNQAAVLKVAHNEVFFELQIQDDSGMFDRYSYNNRIRAQSRIQTLPIGCIIVVHPSLNAETGDIILALHPTISRVVGTKADPSVAINTHKRNVVSEIPIVQVREMDSVILIKGKKHTQNRDVVIIGGLMEERSHYEKVGVPFLSKIPIFGELFQRRDNRRHITELVILLTAKVLEEEGMDAADRNLYKKFTTDPRPLHV